MRSDSRACNRSRVKLLGVVALTMGLGAVWGQPMQSDGGFAGLGSLPLLRNSETRSISAENPRGERAGGARAVPSPGSPASEIGAGWKVRPFIPMPSGSLLKLRFRFRSSRFDATN
jgi:hypothetical protein